MNGAYLGEVRIMRPRSGKTTWAIKSLATRSLKESGQDAYFSYSPHVAEMVKRKSERDDLVTGPAGAALCGQPLDGLVIVDDPIKNMVEARNPLLVETMLDWIRNVLLVRCTISARIVLMGSPFTANCVMGALQREPPHGFVVVHGRGILPRPGIAPQPGSRW